MNLGIETESVEFKKTTIKLKESIVFLASMLNENLGLLSRNRMLSEEKKNI